MKVVDQESYRTVGELSEVDMTDKLQRFRTSGFLHPFGCPFIGGIELCRSFKGGSCPFMKPELQIDMTKFSHVIGVQRVKFQSLIYSLLCLTEFSLLCQ